MINAKQTPCVTGFQIGWCALFDRSAWSVPAGFPEPYLYDRLYSGSEIAVGVEAASAKKESGANWPDFFNTSVAQTVDQLY